MSEGAPALSLAEAEGVVATKTAPRVTKESIEAKIASVEYLRHGLLTICVITMRNGWKQAGQTASASPENHDYEVAKRYAYENAFRPIWELEGYLLREKLRLEAEAEFIGGHDPAHEG